MKANSLRGSNDVRPQKLCNSFSISESKCNLVEKVDKYIIVKGYLAEQGYPEYSPALYDSYIYVDGLSKKMYISFSNSWHEINASAFEPTEVFIPDKYTTKMDPEALQDFLLGD